MVKPGSIGILKALHLVLKMMDFRLNLWETVNLVALGLKLKIW